MVYEIKILFIKLKGGIAYMNKKNEELVIRVYDENGKNVQDVILEAFEKFLKLKLQNVKNI